MPTLAVIGAGPKGIAIAAKARALAAAGLAAPRVVLVDRGPVAGNWTGQQGYTDGLVPLGTPPEKDVGFPYLDSWGMASAAVSAAMAGYSWQQHLIRHGRYADWVDRGGCARRTGSGAVTCGTWPAGQRLRSSGVRSAAWTRTAGGGG